MLAVVRHGPPGLSMEHYCQHHRPLQPAATAWHRYLAWLLAGGVLASSVSGGTHPPPRPAQSITPAAATGQQLSGASIGHMQVHLWGTWCGCRHASSRSRGHKTEQKAAGLQCASSSRVHCRRTQAWMVHGPWVILLARPISR